MEDFAENMADDVFDVYEEEVISVTRGIAESANYHQRLVSKLRLISPQESAGLAYKIQLGKDAQDALDYVDQTDLKKDEDFIRWEKMAEEGRQSKERLIIGHLRLVNHIARLTMGWVPFGQNPVNKKGESVFKGAIFGNLSDFSGYPTPLEDRMQAGAWGLVKAAGKYKADRGANFVTFAFYDIEAAIARTLYEDIQIHLPIHIVERNRKIEKEAQNLKEVLCREPSINEIAQVTGLTYWEVREAIESKKRAWGLESLSNPEQDLLDGVLHPPGERAIDYDAEYFEQVMIEEEADQLLSTLEYGRDERWKDVITLRYGIVTGDKVTLEEIGEKLGLTKERVRQLENQALGYLGNSYTEQQREVIKKTRRDRMIRRVEKRQKLERYLRAQAMAAEIVSAARGAAAGSGQL